MKGFYIEVTNNLLDPKHKSAIGSAVWEFMWCLDKMTSITEEGVGIILGGRPIKLEELAKEMGGHRNTISNNLNRLAKQGYINLTRTPRGIIIQVNKAKKRFTKNSESQKTVNHKILESNIRHINTNKKEIYKEKKTITKITPKKKTIADEKQELLVIFIDEWNKEQGTRFKPTESLHANFTYWTEVYTWPEIFEALHKVKLHAFWKDKMTPTIFLRRKNTNHEDVDYIGELLNTKKPQQNEPVYRNAREVKGW